MLISSPQFAIDKLLKLVRLLNGRSTLLPSEPSTSRTSLFRMGVADNRDTTEAAWMEGRTGHENGIRVFVERHKSSM